MGYSLLNGTSSENQRLIRLHLVSESLQPHGLSKPFVHRKSINRILIIVELNMLYTHTKAVPYRIIKTNRHWCFKYHILAAQFFAISGSQIFTFLDLLISVSLNAISRLIYTWVSIIDISKFRRTDSHWSILPFTTPTLPAQHLCHRGEAHARVLSRNN